MFAFIDVYLLGADHFWLWHAGWETSHCAYRG